MKVLSLYAGAGGIDEGLKQAGIKTTLAIDWEFDACKTLKLNHPDTEVICGRVSDYLGSIGNMDCIVGGPPCPEFSRAKKDRSFDTCELNNFWSFVDTIKPKYHLMENVQDVVKVLKRRNFLVNCADYGVPQTRLRRIYTNLPLPKPTHIRTPSSDLFGNNIKKWVSVKDALGLEGLLQNRSMPGWKNKTTDRATDKPSSTIISDNSGNGVWFISYYGHNTQNRENITRSIDEPIDTIVVRNDMRLTNYDIKSVKKIRNRNRHLKHQNMFERKLTNHELSILQGFPPDYKWHGNQSSVKRQIGNALPPPVIKAFFEQIT